MAIQTEPTRIQIPFADSGTKNVIPDTNSTPSASQAASWTDGFPAQCSLPLSAGGIPPARADFNGIFNTMTQSERFTQEGGVWEWDATVDYGANRLVLGSDGILYWSVAQSGPNVGGAQDPTADDGTYWQAPPAKTMSPLEDSSATASTAWVREAIGYTPLYVDGTSGSDANDGTSQATAVKTLGQAIALSEKHLGQRPKIYVAAGTYAEDIVLYGRNIMLELQGNVTLIGMLTVRENSSFVVDGSYTFAVDGPTYIAVTSFLYFICDVSLSCSTSAYTIAAHEKSYVAFGGACSITNNNGSGCVSLLNGSGLYSTNILNLIANGATRVFAAYRGSNARLVAGLSASGSGANTGIGIADCSTFESTGAITIPSGLISTYAFRVSGSSSARLDGGNSEIHGPSSDSSSIIRVDSCSFFAVDQGAKLTVHVDYTGAGSLWAVAIRGSSCFYIFSSSNLSFSFANSATAKYLIVAYNGMFLAEGGSTIDFGTGSVTTTITSDYNGLIDISNTATVTGTITGKRYAADYGGMIYVHGSGANRIPGTTAGTVTSATYGYYG